MGTLYVVGLRSAIWRTLPARLRCCAKSPHRRRRYTHDRPARSATPSRRRSSAIADFSDSSGCRADRRLHSADVALVSDARHAGPLHWATGWCRLRTKPAFSQPDSRPFRDHRSVSSGLPTDAFPSRLPAPPGRCPPRAGRGPRPALHAGALRVHRLLRLLADVEAVLDDRHLVVARELTNFTRSGGDGKRRPGPFWRRSRAGEITLVIAGKARGDRLGRGGGTGRLTRGDCSGAAARANAAAVAELSGWRKKAVRAVNTARLRPVRPVRSCSLEPPAASRCPG